MIKLNSREVCWDEFLLDSSENITVKMHTPQRRGIAFSCTAPWEGNVCGYWTVFRDGPTVRLYYRAMNIVYDRDGKQLGEVKGVICYAESRDGITFTRPELGLYEYLGSYKNNIIYNEDCDNFSVFKDTNPACPDSERYKALMGDYDNGRLVLFASADGIRFERTRELDLKGKYDSLNLAHWNAALGKYLLYFRGLHDGDGSWSESYVRDVRVVSSPDFVNWSEPQRIAYGPEAEDYELYTNNIRPCERAPQMLLGMPTRYCDRKNDAENLAQLPNFARRGVFMKSERRTGTAMTDCVLMTSRDGLNFRRTDEAFHTPGPERSRNWVYGDCYISDGIVETDSPLESAPPELSFYCGENYRSTPVELVRFAVRRDGFFSWSCGFREGSFLTKPFVFSGSALEVNFSTSALGWLRLALCAEDGTELAVSPRLFGDSDSRRVDFSGDIAALAGRSVRLSGRMRDAELYSFMFR